MAKDSKKTRVIIIGAVVNALFAGKLHDDFDVEIGDPSGALFIKNSLLDIKTLDDVMSLTGVWKKACKCDWPCQCDSKFKTSNIRKLPEQNYKGLRR